MSKQEKDNLLSKAKETLKKEILSIEERTDISDDEKVSRIIKIFSTTCAALAVQPIPFADIFVLTPIQAFMGTRIGAIRGVPVSEEKATDIIKEIAGVIGLGLLAQQLVIGGYKTFIPFLGALTTIPIVYGMTYAIGKVIDVYFIKKKRNQKFDPEELKKIWQETYKQKKAEGKQKRKDIWESRKNMNPKLEYLKKNFDEIAILAVITKITLGKFSELSIDDEPVIQALRRYKTDFNGATLEEMGEYFSKMDSESVSKAINNIQGILHEVEWVNIENSDGDSIMVGMFPETNHEDYDIWAIDSNTGEMWTEQLKATMDKSAIRDWMDEHPDGTIRVDQEMAEELDLPTTGLDRDELRVRIEDVVEKLKDSADEDTIWDYLPVLGGITMASIVWSLYQEYKSGIISEERFKALVVRATGLKIAKIATLMLLLSIPVVNVITGTAIIYRLISSGRQILDS